MGHTLTTRPAAPETSWPVPLRHPCQASRPRQLRAGPDPERAGWECPSLRVVAPAPGGSLDRARRRARDLVLPRPGLQRPGRWRALRDRRSATRFTDITDYVHVPRRIEVTPHHAVRRPHRPARGQGHC